jgi:hypothetical protein
MVSNMAGRLNAFVCQVVLNVPSRGYEVPLRLILRSARPWRVLKPRSARSVGKQGGDSYGKEARRRGTSSETQPGCGLISDITHAAPGRGEGGKIGAAGKGRDALQAVLKKATAAVGKGIHGLCAEGARGRAHCGDRCWVPRWCLLGDRLTRHNRGKERSAVPTEFKTEPSRLTHGVGLAEAPCDWSELCGEVTQ